jgi:pyruvate dehydrogenase E2 component (dihydrolipoamide acetyltransferase)
MIYEFKLPDIGEGVVEGEVVRWLVEEGDQVREDQPLVEVMTDKATVEIPAPRAGRVARRMYAEGQICPVGKVLVTIEIEAAAPAAARAAVTTAAPTGPESPGAALPGGGGGGGRAGDRSGAPVGGAASVLATPATRKLARDLGVDVRQVAGTGRGGRITSDDVRAFGSAAGAPVSGAVDRAAPSPSSRPSPSSSSLARPVTATVSDAGDVRIPFRGVRKKIAEHLVHSKHTAAHFTYVEEIDCTELVLLRAKANEKLAAREVKLSYLPFIIKATVGALAKFPQLNATLDEQAGEIVQRRAHHIGLATATDNGLIVPVIRDATGKSMVELAREIDRLAEATRTGKATREELSGSTFTITSLGALGGLLATPIINFPEVAILGIHKISKRPAVVGDKIVARDLMNLSISVDHRIVDGLDAARFVADIKATLESPGLLMVDLV